MRKQLVIAIALKEQRAWRSWFRYDAKGGAEKKFGLSVGVGTA